MQNTSNLNLKKPEGTDLVDINDLNGNMDILDTAVKAVQDHAADTVKHITAAERTAWNAKASTAVATTTTAGLESAADKAKLDGIAAGANNYTHPSTHPPAIIAQDASNRFVTDTEKSTWNAKASTAVATTTTAGLESAADKVKLDGIAAGANAYVHPNHTGDVTSTGDGVTAISPGVIVDADVNAAAAIAWSKLSKTGASLADLPTRSAGDLSSGTLPAARLPAISGDITMAAGAGTASITAGAIVNADINAAAAIDAAKIGGGIVSNAEFGYLDGVMAPIQGQINAKADLSTTPQQTTADITYYVRTDGNDSNTGLVNTAGGAFKSIQKAVDMLPKIINHAVIINVAAGSYPAIVNVKGFSGTETISIIGAASATTTHSVAGFDIYQCSCLVGIIGFMGTRTDFSPFNVVRSMGVSINLCVVTSSAPAQHGFYADGSKVYIGNGIISNRAAAIYAHVTADVLAQGMSGTGNITAYRAAYGGKIAVDGGTLSGTNINDVSFGGGISTVGTINPWGDNTLTSRSAGRASMSAAQTLSANTFTKLIFNTGHQDYSGEFNTTLNRFVAKKSGWYLVTGGVGLVSAPVGTTVSLIIFSNGNREVDIGSFSPSGTASGISVYGSSAFYLSAGSYVELFAYPTNAVTTHYGSILTSFTFTQLA